jgi:hypothetical protein
VRQGIAQEFRDLEINSGMTNSFTYDGMKSGPDFCGVVHRFPRRLVWKGTWTAVGECCKSLPLCINSNDGSMFDDICSALLVVVQPDWIHGGIERLQTEWEVGKHIYGCSNCQHQLILRRNALNNIPNKHTENTTAMQIGKWQRLLQSRNGQ